MEEHVDLNTQIRLVRVPTADYPSKETGVFQIKVVPPIPTDRIAEGEVAVRNIFISIDAAMRVWISGLRTYIDPVLPGDLMKAAGVGEVIYSRCKSRKVGDKVLGMFGWQKYAVVKAKQTSKLPQNYPHPEHFLGVLGISGLTAYFGLNKIGQPKAGEVLVVSAAAGAVGEIVVQLGKHLGCVVCGIAGSESKCKYLESLGANYVINYKKEQVGVRIKQLIPQGIDIYFDNVGGMMLDNLIMSLKEGGRIVLCGTISTYNQTGKDAQKSSYRLKNYSRLIIKRAKMQGFIYFDFAKEFPSAIADLMSLIKNGKLRFKIDYQNGLEECPRALKRLLMGQNEGKVIVRVNKQDENPKL